MASLLEALPRAGHAICGTASRTECPYFPMLAQYLFRFIKMTQFNCLKRSRLSVGDMFIVLFTCVEPKTRMITELRSIASHFDGISTTGKDILLKCSLPSRIFNLLSGPAASGSM
jgi:hypothetical protein